MQVHTVSGNRFRKFQPSECNLEHMSPHLQYQLLQRLRRILQAGSTATNAISPSQEPCSKPRSLIMTEQVVKRFYYETDDDDL